MIPDASLCAKVVCYIEVDVKVDHKIYLSHVYLRSIMCC